MNVTQIQPNLIPKMIQHTYTRPISTAWCNLGNDSSSVHDFDAWKGGELNSNLLDQIGICGSYTILFTIDTSVILQGNSENVIELDSIGGCQGLLNTVVSCPVVSGVLSSPQLDRGVPLPSKVAW
jgi:hypothetical protein